MTHKMNSYQDRLSRNSLLLLKPLIRILLRAGIGFANFAEWVKFAYVDVAEQDFQIEGRNQSTSRIATLTGLHRKEVARIRAALQEESPIFTTHTANRAERVIHAWLRDARFLDAQGHAKPLPLSGEISFETLAQTASGDIHTTAILDELLRIDAVKLDDHNQVNLKARAYIPDASSEEQLDIMGQSVFDLLATLDHNMNKPLDTPHVSKMQRSVAYHYLTATDIAAFKEYSYKESEKLLETLNTWLAARDLAAQKESLKEPVFRAGTGIYYFDEIPTTQQRK
ncbi:MAG: hypothetical protein HRU20_00475 [Pseudomonadales bacterium]|nr:hypothetical protein [Pseudomonadales bacterium]